MPVCLRTVSFCLVCLTRRKVPLGWHRWGEYRLNPTGCCWMSQKFPCNACTQGLVLWAGLKEQWKPHCEVISAKVSDLRWALWVSILEGWRGGATCRAAGWSCATRLYNSRVGLSPSEVVSESQGSESEP